MSKTAKLKLRRAIRSTKHSDLFKQLTTEDMKSLTGNVLDAMYQQGLEVDIPDETIAAVVAPMLEKKFAALEKKIEASLASLATNVAKATGTKKAKITFHKSKK